MTPIAQNPAKDQIRQATHTAGYYLHRAQQDIDECFGTGYAAKHPELVVAYMQIASADFTSETWGSLFYEFTQNLTSAISRIADALDKE